MAKKLILFYSGSMMGPAQPERALWLRKKKKPAVMLTYDEIHGCRMNETLRRVIRLQKQREKDGD